MATRKPQATTGEPAATAAFVVMSNLSLDNSLYEPGDQVDLTEAQALELGPQVVRPVAAADKAGE